MTKSTKQPSDAQLSEQAREALKQAATGSAQGARNLTDVRTSNPPSAEAAEQEASDGPPGRGLSR